MKSWIKGVTTGLVGAMLILAAHDAFAQGRIYETAGDFQNGILISLNNGEDGLTMEENATPLPFIYVPIPGRESVVRIDTQTGDILGEYRTAPETLIANGRRVAVDNLGNCWVGNWGEEDGSCDGDLQGSVTRIGVVIGGTRVNADGEPDENGEYLKPPFDYSTCFDRDGDGLIRTSRGAMDILGWPNAKGEDTCGGVSTAEDETILNFARTEAEDPGVLCVDAGNDLWAGGNEFQFFLGKGEIVSVVQQISGVLGIPVPDTARSESTCGARFGGSGVIRPNGTLWSFDDNQSFEPMLLDTEFVETRCTTDILQARSTAIDPTTGEIWFTIPVAQQVAKLNENGVVDTLIDLSGPANDLAVDSNGEVWVAIESTAGGTEPGILERFAPDVNNPGEYIRISGIPLGASSAAALVSVDAEGKIWVGDTGESQLYRVDPNLSAGPPRVRGGGPEGAVDLIVPLGADGAAPAFGDATGFGVLSGTSSQASWTVVFDSEQPGTPWGTARWQVIEPRGTGLKVQVRAAEQEEALATQEFVCIENGVSFSGIRGRYIEIQSVFEREFGNGETPQLERLEIEAAECHMLVGEGAGEDIYRFGINSHAFQTRLRNVYKSYPVLMEDIPAVTLNLPEPDMVGSTGGKGGFDSGIQPWRTFFVQIVMWNPAVFPENPEQSTPGMRVDVYPDGRVTTSKYGEPDGIMDCEIEVTDNGDGTIRLRVPFVVGGF